MSPVDDDDDEEDHDSDDVGENWNLNVPIVDRLCVIRPIVIALLPTFLNTPNHHSVSIAAMQDRGKRTKRRRMQHLVSMTMAREFVSQHIRQ